jgi:hypothetical protein
MKSSFAISLLLGAALYAATGLFGLAIFHNAGPVSRVVSDGYGVAYGTIATARASTGAEAGKQRGAPSYE